MMLPYRSQLLATTLLVGAAITPQAAFAQTDAAPAQAPTAATTDTSTGDIVVTGSLIRNPNLVSSTPVSVVDQKELSLRQTNTAEQVLRDLPGAVPSIGSAVNNGNGGAAFADLRGLGNFRNVVLLDGVRITPSSTVGRVDLNNIPLALIERVDTLTGGAATTYGADAVSGVINFVTRQDFSGVEASVSNQITGKGDGKYFRGDLTIGANLDDGRGNVVLSVGYQKADPVYQGARKISLNNYTSTSGSKGGSGTTVPGRFTLPKNEAAGYDGGYYTVHPSAGGLLQPYKGSTDGYNFNPYNVFQVPFERYNVYAAGHYDVTDNIEVYARGMFSKNKVETIIAPSGVFGQLLTIPYSNPYLPTTTRNQFCAANGVTQAQCDLAAAATDPNDPNFRTFTTTVGRRMPETGPRTSEFVTQFFDYRAGVKIGITDTMSLDVSGAYGESENRQTQNGYVLISRLRTAVYATNTTTCLGASPTVPNPNPLLPPLASAGAATNAGTGCVPVNIFGANGSILPNQVPYLTAAAGTAQLTSLAQARALLSGDFGLTLPGASSPVGFALGAEYRRYSATQTADVLSQTAGELGGAGGATPNYTGGYDVKEVYGEINAPILSDKPFFKNLTLEAGVRYSSYSVNAPNNPSYSTTTYKAGGTWEPVDGLKFRGDYQRAVRAPNIAELFSPLNTGLTNLAVDPCNSKNPAVATNPNLYAVCIMQGATAATIGSIANPTAGQANATTSGGTYLRPETSDSYTIGVVFQPRVVPGLSITVDYYNIRVKNAISQPVPGDLITGCFGDNTGYAANVNNPICQLFKRNPATGGLDGDPATTQGLLFPSTNSGKILTDGIDLGINYRRDLGFAKLNLSFMGNWTHRSQFQALTAGTVVPAGSAIGAGLALPVTDTRECVGYYSQNCGSPGSAGPSSSAGSLQPKFTWNQRTTLTFGNIDLSLLWRHIDSMQAEPGVVAFNGTISSGVLAGQQVNFGKIPAYNYFDLSARFGVSENFDLTISVMNMFDKDPPIVGGTIGSTSYNSGNTFPSTYDALGRRFAVGARLKF
ncbi:MAG: TonB-dependent receptor [Proteobacteria bacterium]|nr:TonB-dependent receptor [Pseudomonadota bacterium]